MSVWARVGACVCACACVCVCVRVWARVWACVCTQGRGSSQPGCVNQCSGARPRDFSPVAWTLTLAPASSSSCSGSTLPQIPETCSGVSPSVFFALTLAPFASSRFISSTSPSDVASMSA